MTFDYQVRDLGLAEAGRHQIRLAEHEMPGLMSLREEFGASQPLERRPDRRLAAHDRADRRADRDPHRARRRGPLGLLQHLLHPGRGRRRRRRRPARHRRGPAGRPRLRLEGRDAGGVLVDCTEQILTWPGGDGPEHDPGRRRRRHAAGAQGRRVRGRRRRPAPPTEDTRGGPRHPRRAARIARRGPAEVDPHRRPASGRHRGDHHRRAPPVPAAPSRASCSSRRSTSTTRSPRASSTTSTASGTPCRTASTAPPTS